MQTQFWAVRKRKKTGPHESRESALAAFRAGFPFKGKPYEARAAIPPGQCPPVQCPNDRTQLWSQCNGR